LQVTKAKFTTNGWKQREHDLPVNIIHKVDQHKDQQHLPLLPAEVRKLHLEVLNSLPTTRFKVSTAQRTTAQATMCDILRHTNKKRGLSRFRGEDRNHLEAEQGAGLISTGDAESLASARDTLGLEVTRLLVRTDQRFSSIS
jgi:hypothetical protein